MTAREKRLLIFLVTGIFVIANLIGINALLKKRTDLHNRTLAAEKQLEGALMIRDNADQFAPEMDWLNERDLAPKNEQDVQNELKQFAYQEAQRSGLQVSSQKLLDAVAPESGRFHRSRVEFKVNGREEPFYRWCCDKLQSPDQLRAITYLRLVPAREDDTKIEATVIVEQWFIPVNVTP